MSEYHRPTHTLEEQGYNATQVRLYGIDPQAIEEDQSSEGRFSTGKIIFEDKPEDTETKPTEVQLPIVSFLILQTKLMGGVVLATFDDKEKKKDHAISAGIIFGYAYEGHCYDFPKPKIMLIRALPEDIPADDCGFEAKPNYRVWVVDKLNQCAEIELNQGFVEQIVLEANLPGKRSPKSYSATMQLAHRSGRLTE